MARFPTSKGDKDNWDTVLKDYLDVSLDEEGRLRPEAVGLAVPAETPSLSSLDIWPDFDGTGAGAGSWDATTYDGYIDGLDNSLSGAIGSGDVVKADLGEASDESTHIYSYSAGSGPISVLIIGGQHGNETLGIWAAMRWFQQFATNDELQMRQLRSAFRVTWVPVLNASRYRSERTNANGVDTNRNFDLLWGRYSPSGAADAKGDAAFDQPETQIVKGLLDTGDYRVVIDCHNYSADGDTMGFGLPGHWYLGSRRLNDDAIRVWESVYGADTTWSYMSRVQVMPTLVNYANWHLQHLNGKDDSATLLIEASADLFGSVTTESATRPAVQRYAGMIQTYLLAVLANGGRATATPYSYTLYGARSAQAASTPIAEGGTLITSSTEAPITFARHDLNGATLNVSSYDVPLMVAPCVMRVDVNGTIRSLGNIAGRHGVYININDTNNSNERVTVSVSDVNLEGTQFAATAYRIFDTISNESVPTVEVGTRRISGGDAELLLLTLAITVIPHTNTHLIPRIDGA